ncbi:MAG: hypothetical protein KME21_00155 [Desmonostoc vinosum HA7617-LM4]|jgi:hypothetical protein|nr:hypothetical protein [Desmonostoc vinosum HA7617-LM4]
MITHLSCFEELSTSQTEAISGGFAVKWDQASYNCFDTPPATGTRDWTVTWVRKGQTNSKDVYNFYCRYA